MLYFNHDTSASNDERISQLRLIHGGAAVDAYWYIVERVYKDEKPLVLFDNPAETKLVSYRLCVGFEVLETWVSTMIEIGLLKNEKGLTSDRIEANLKAYKLKSETAKTNGKKGGRPRKTQGKNHLGSSSVSVGFSENNPANNQNVTQQEPSEKLIKSKSKSKDIGFSPKEEKPNIFAREGAAGGEAAALNAQQGTAPHCAKCGSLVTFKPAQGVFHCMTHGMIKPGEGVEFR